MTRATHVLDFWVTNRYFCLSLEIVLALIIVAVALAKPEIGSSWLLSAEQRIARFGRRRRPAVLVVMLLVTLGRAALLPVIPVPQPSVHDEFSYLLAGRTFASGRLTNQPHVMWPHFESVHILQQPTYMSMYQPAQGLFLALGIAIAGQAWIGVLVSVALMAGTVCWMLQQWVSAPWAFIGGVLVAIRWGLFSYWANSYWGGAVTAIGGALLVGSLPRLLRWGRVRDSLILALGLAVLANSRPYEGLIFSTTVIAAFAAWAIKHSLWRRISKAEILFPPILFLGLVAGGMMYYNWRITGAALQLPYDLNRKQYAIAPLLLFLGVRSEPHYRTTSLRRVYEAEVKLYIKSRAELGIPEILRKLKDFWIFYFGPVLTLPLLALGLHRKSMRDWRVRFFLLVLAVTISALLLEVWFYPHYAAPSLAVTVGLIVVGMRQLRGLRWQGKPTGLFLSRVIPIACLLMGIVPLSAAAFGLGLNYWPLQWYGGTPNVVRPSNLTERFVETRTKALIFVRYSATHDVGDEWVYNEPDIDKAQVVWAREINPVDDAALVHYFADRSVWLLEPDKRPWTLQPYEVAFAQR